MDNRSAEIGRYTQCLLRQKGAGGPWENGVVFSGRRGQRGFGFGALFKSLGKAIIRTVANPKVRDTLIKGAVDLGKKVIFERKKPSQALLETGKQILGNIINKQEGSGSTRKRKTKRTADIFDSSWKSKRTKRV